MAMHPSGDLLYVASGDGIFSVIDTALNAVVRVIELGCDFCSSHPIFVRRPSALSFYGAPSLSIRQPFVGAIPSP
jgi:hypothetical protein